MSLLKKLLDLGKPDESEGVRKANEFISQIETLIKKNNRVLISCGLPVPERLSDFSYEIERQADKNTFSLNFTLPRFDLPSWITLRFRPSEYCIWVGQPEHLNTRLHYLNRKDELLHELVETHFPRKDIQVGWATGDPYLLYKDLSRQKAVVPHVQRFEISKEPLFELAYHQHHSEKLKSARIWTADEIKDYEMRLLTFLTLIDGYLNRGETEKSHIYTGELQTVYSILPDELWKKLPPADFDKPREENNSGFYPDFYPENYTCVKIIPDCPVKPALMKQFFENLCGLGNTIIFTLVALDNTISFELSYAPQDAALVEQQLILHFPAFTVIEQAYREFDNDYGDSIYFPQKPYSSLKIMSDFHLDPYNQFCDVLSAALDSSHEARFEVWCRPFSISDTQTVTSFFEGRYYSQEYINQNLNCPNEEWRKDTYKLFQKKTPAWWVCIKLWAIGEYPGVKHIVGGLRNALKQYENLDQGWKHTERHQGNLVSVDELISLAHFPTMDLACDRLELATMKTKLPPSLYAHGGTQIGVSEARGKKQIVFLPEEIRDRHIYVVGKSGTGKSTLVETIARADIEVGLGVTVIDPHGDMIRHLMDSMPEHRLKDCIYFSPKHSPVSLDILAAKTEQEIDLLTDDLVTMFRRTSESWGDKMQAILQMTFQTLLRVPGSSFVDITPLLTDKHYRSQILAKMHHPQLVSFWENRYDVRQAEPILIRMDRLTTSNALRSVLTQHDHSVNFYDVIRQGKIFLADISKGDLGESTSHLLGSIIVSQIQLAVMRQAQLSVEQRVPFSLFVDEVQNFTTGTFSTILSEARKYKLHLTIAHQFVSQLPQEIQKAIFGNVGTMVFFSMSPDDLGAARYELGTYEPADVANLPKFHALCRPSTAARDTFSFTTIPPGNIQKENAGQKRTSIINSTQMQFGQRARQIGNDRPTLDEKVEVVSPPPKEVVDLNPNPNNQTHRYLQTLVKRIGESKGFIATIEKEVFGGIGKIDVALESETRKIACEISVTNDPAYEVQNIQKCLTAGYCPVILISADKRHLRKIKLRSQKNLSAEQLTNVYFLEPETFHLFLESLSDEDLTNPVVESDKIKGYKVNLKFKEPAETETKERKQTILALMREVDQRKEKNGN